MTSDFWSPALAWLSLSVSCMLHHWDSGKFLLYGDPFSAIVFPSGCLVLNTFNRMGIPFLLIPNLPPFSPPRLGCGIVILLQLPISWRCIILVYLLQIVFVIFTTAESTFVVCGQSTAPFVIVFLVAHCIGS